MIERAAVYQNSGNELVLSLIPDNAKRILDVGCGAGDNARRLLLADPTRVVVGLTYSAKEAELARSCGAAVYVVDLALGAIKLDEAPFDVIIFSHVLEHIADPVSLLSGFIPMLRVGGAVVVAVPNVLEWRTRLAFLRGKFIYAEHGILDRTHLRFYTYRTAELELVSPHPELRVMNVRTRGAIPLGSLRRWILSERMRARLDAVGVRWWPNMFASEVAILAERIEVGLKA